MAGVGANPGVSSVSRSSSAIDGMLVGFKWSGPITYSDPRNSGDYQVSHPYAASPGISQISSTQIGAVNATLNALGPDAGFSVEGFTNLDISYAGVGGGGTIRYANIASSITAVANYPGGGVSSGDVFFGASGRAPVLGNYDYLVTIHETGHALGLMHPHEGGLPAALDSMEYSVVSYRSYVGGQLTGYTNEQYSYAQTWMPGDIAALQHMYGPDYTSNAGNTVYSWNPLTGATLIDGVVALQPGANRVFMALWDGGGIDTYNASNYSAGVRIDLTPGASSALSSAQIANLGSGHFAAGNVYNALQVGSDARSLIENATGGSGNDTLIGNAAANLLIGGAGNDALFGEAGNDTLEGGLGADALHGGSGSDVALFSGPMHDYTFGWIGGGAVGPDTLDSVEQLNFANIALNLADRTKVDPLFYLGVNVDVKNADMDPTEHYRAYGWAEGRDPNANVHLATFEGLDYIASYADLADALGVNAPAGKEHFATTGLFEGRTVSFDGEEYIASYADLINAFHSASSDDVGASHFIDFGRFEGRAPDLFDAASYIAHYADISAAFGENTDAATHHYITNGYYEGRTDS